MEKIAIYGKGGIGKSTISSCISASFAKQKKKVLHVGCDPKQDSCIRLLHGEKIQSVMQLISKKEEHTIDEKDIIHQGAFGVSCIEAGGPKPGVGCAGRGITKTFEILKEKNILHEERFDVAIYDVLGDVVCGGFATPLREKIGEKILIVVSEEIMSLYAANNILHAIQTYEHNGIFLAGLIVNHRNNAAPIEHIKKFAEKTNTKIIMTIPRSQLITESEKMVKTVIEEYPHSKITQRMSVLGERILNITQNDSAKPRPLNDEEFNNIFIEK
jgi:nitrogenase iron protein NifH